MQHAYKLQMDNGIDVRLAYKITDEVPIEVACGYITMGHSTVSRVGLACRVLARDANGVGLVLVVREACRHFVSCLPTLETVYLSIMARMTL